MVISPRPSGQVLSDAVSGLGRVWRALAVPALAISIPAGAITLLVFRFNGGGVFLDLAINRPDALQRLPREVFAEVVGPFYTSATVAVVVQTIATLLIALASHKAVASDLAGKALDGKALIRAAIRRFLVGLGAMTVVILGLAVLFGLGATLWSVPARIVGTPNSTSTIVASLLFIALLGPGVWAATAASMTTSVVGVEGRGVLGSVRRSMHLVRGRWWATAGFLVVVGLFGGLAVYLIQLIALPMAATGVGGPLLRVAAVVGIVTQGLLVAAIAAVYTHWYVDLRSRRERLVSSDLG